MPLTRRSPALSPTLSPCPLPPQREAVAVAFVKKGKGLIKVNGVPIELVQPETLRFKARPSS